MKIKGLKQIKKGVKLIDKKIKIEEKLQKEANQYFDEVNFENRNIDYFINCCKAHKKQNNK